MAQDRGFKIKGRVKPETAYGAAPAGNFVNVPFLPGFTLGKQQGLLIDDRLGTGVEEIDPELDSQNVSGAVVVPLDVRGIGWWLRLLMGAPVTTGAGPYTHVFKSNGETVPSLAIELERLGNRFFQFLGIVGESIEIPLARTGWANATIQCTGRQVIRAGATIGGAATSPVVKRLTNKVGTIKKDGAALGHVQGGTLRLANNYEVIEALDDSGLVGGYDLGIKTGGGQLDIRFANEDFLDAADARTAVEFERAWVNSVDESLTIKLPRTFIVPTTPPIQTRTGIVASYSFTASGEDAEDGALMVATLVNDVASYA